MGIHHRSRILHWGKGGTAAARFVCILEDELRNEHRKPRDVMWHVQKCMQKNYWSSAASQ